MHIVNHTPEGKERISKARKAAFAAMTPEQRALWSARIMTGQKAHRERMKAALQLLNRYEEVAPEALSHLIES